MPGITPMISPGVRVNIVDQSQYTALPGLPTNAFAIVGGAQFGPINVPTLLTSVNQFIQTFSTPIDTAGLTAINTLGAGGTIYYTRFASSDAVAMTATLQGTSTGNTEAANFKITATKKGTLLEGKWKAIASVGTNSSEFKLKITRTVGTSDPITVIEETELAFDPSAANAYTTWNNDFFTIELADPNKAPAALTYDKPDGSQTKTFMEVDFTEGNNGIYSGDGADTKNAPNIVKAIDVFSDRETYEIMYLSAPEYSIIGDVAQELKSVAAGRKDCIAQIDHDPNPNAVVYLTESDPKTFSISKFIGVLSQYATTPYVGLWAGLGGYIIDPYNNNTERLVPVSAYLLPALAAEYTVNPVWTAPASTAYLNLNSLVKLDKIWSQDDRDKLYAANINPITNYKGLGYTSMGQKSGQTSKSAMDRLNVVQLVNYIKVAIEKISVDFLFAPIDDETFGSWSYRVGNLLESIRTRRGLYDYKVKMDWETVTSDAVNNNLMPGIVQIKPTKVAEFIDIDLIIKNYSDSME